MELEQVQADFGVAKLDPDGRRAVIRMCDLAGGAEKDVLVRLRLPACVSEDTRAEDAAPVLQCKCEWGHAATGAPRQMHCAMSLRRARGRLHAQCPAGAVEYHRLRLEAVDAMEATAALCRDHASAGPSAPSSAPRPAMSQFPGPG